MSIPSLRSMEVAKEIKRADASKIRYAALYKRENFNPRLDLKRFDANVEIVFERIANGATVLPLEVVPRDPTGAWIIDGYGRHAAVGKAIALNLPLKQFRDKDGEVWLPITRFEGDEIDEMLRPVTSQNQLKLLQIETATQYRRTRDKGASVEEIAKRIGKTPQHVTQMLFIADAGPRALEMIIGGKVSVAEAVKAVRRLGAVAADIYLDEQLSAAQSMGKAKITAGTIAAGKPNRSSFDDLLAACLANLELLPESVRDQVHAIRTDSSNAKAPVEIISQTEHERPL